MNRLIIRRHAESCVTVADGLYHFVKKVRLAAPVQLHFFQSGWVSEYGRGNRGKRSFMIYSLRGLLFRITTWGFVTIRMSETRKAFFFPRIDSIYTLNKLPPPASDTN